MQATISITVLDEIVWKLTVYLRLKNKLPLQNMKETYESLKYLNC